ncbi:MFS transporter [Streptomyces ficellus]|uniref:MFS transporter n=1 Tax=Streptomyces ficellus TaxID=1977088 RepID=A0A6I6F8M8_9ACTN|nr:MFS transporter [Streptomyces ficellus]QGV79234.1 MFS transporter [Streptomyces ficellus]
MTDARLRRGRGSLAVSFFVQGVTFALLVTRIPAVQNRYGISDALLPAFLAAVPVLAGAGSAGAGALVRRVAPSTLLRWAQPLVLLSLVAVGSGERLWHVAVALGVFGLAVGALDASMNMLGVSLQQAYGRSIMLGFHAAYSLGGIVGASLAWAAVHWQVPLGVSYLAAVGVMAPAAWVGSRWYVDGERRAGGPSGRRVGVLVPLCLVMTFAYIGDSTVSNWSAIYLTDVLAGSEELATVPYNAYMVTTLLGRAVGDAGVRRFGAVAVVRGGALLAAAGFAVVATAPGAWAGVAGFTVLGLGLSVLVPQTFAAARGDAEVARLNVFNYVGFLVGSPLVGALGEAWSYRGAMAVPLVLVLLTLRYARSFAVEPYRYGGGHERPRTVDVG